ncbi:hypothetical protein DL764_000463 [Monosporascus ibericus]|uniref:Cytochrome P450 n=1 Tax=Monosporascus ibericus TaxID=155417 RepID=A0A4Q4TWV6_9PEZI|nr:hypothetical protein DL764_000463 [Monosporascus ibericus]
MAAYTSHRDPAVFADPEVYNPERWIQNKGTGRMKAMLAAFMSFTAGTRACIGHNISLQMQKVTVATLPYRYEFSVPKPRWEVESRSGSTCGP